jgi:hypothetical protein
MTNTRLAYAIALGASTLLWVVTSWGSGKVEPWDASGYWTTAYPAAILLAGGLGYFFPERPWRWALVVIFTQLVVMIVGGSGFGLLPLGMLLLAVLSLPAIALAGLAARIRLRRA